METKVATHQRVREILESQEEKIKKLIGKNYASFISAVVSASALPHIAGCSPQSIVSSALEAARLNLPVDSRGYAYLVPYKGVCTFQMGWKGFVQLALRNKNCTKIAVIPINKEAFITWNPLEEKLSVDFDKLTDQNPIGFYAFFKVGKFEKAIYRTKEQLMEHGKKYSQSYDSPSSVWKLKAPEMCAKTLVKEIIKKWFPMDDTLAAAVEKDQAELDSDGNILSYPDVAKSDTPKPEAQADADSVLSSFMVIANQEKEQENA